ncbi:saccharopine dehydrogenase family protein [Plantactinospora sp. WMMB334]|uniref:saccharopine dehydrogenase family protein n=1 Tax=Plantactinospora sp. WMMB334 TaxID=3404119 RepID=UPI003B95D0EA
MRDESPGAPAGGTGTDGRIVVVGGYGAVGRIVAQTLGKWCPGRVVVAGRSLERARALTALAPTAALLAEAVDIDRAAGIERMLRGTRVVVMCVERNNETLARACLQRGIGYVDVSATASVLESIGRLDALAVAHGATAALSVGLAPGLTNVLARYCVDRLPSARAVDLAVLLGTAGDHGPDSVRWTVERLGEPVRPAPGTPSRAVAALPDLGRRTVHWFPFSDQSTLTATLGVPVTTRICFDSRAVTAVAFGLRAAGFFAALCRLGATPLRTRALSRLGTGTDRFAVQATAIGPDGERVCGAVTGRQECRATGIVTAQVARRVYLGRTPAGVRHIDQFVDAEAFLNELPTRHLALHLARR